MNRLELITAAALLVMLAQAAEAGNPDPARIEPEPGHSGCVNLIGLPCHEPGKPTTMDGSDGPTPQPPVECSMNDWTPGVYARGGGRPKKEGAWCTHLNLN